MNCSDDYTTSGFRRTGEPFQVFHVKAGITPTLVFPWISSRLKQSHYGDHDPRRGLLDDIWKSLPQGNDMDPQCSLRVSLAQGTVGDSVFEPSSVWAWTMDGLVAVGIARWPTGCSWAPRVSRQAGHISGSPSLYGAERPWTAADGGAMYCCSSCWVRGGTSNAAVRTALGGRWKALGIPVAHPESFRGVYAEI